MGVGASWWGRYTLRMPSHAHVRVPLPPSVTLARGRGDLPCVWVASDRHGSGEVYLNGAHVTAWRPPEQAPVLWVSRESAFVAGRPIRGGVPICFPWFSTHQTDKGAPAHGFARTCHWGLTEARDGPEGVSLSFTLADDDRTLASAWPHRFLATYRLTFGPSLEMSLTIRNADDAIIRFEEALHTYFRVHNVREITIGGLEGTEYLDKVDGFARRRQGAGPIRFAGEMDRVYLDTSTPCTIHDPGRRRAIRIAKTGSSSTVVWNPWMDRARAMPDFGDLEWAEMVCVETANVGAAAIVLEPGREHTMTATLTVAPLAS
jgi:glucose-6-phosphate 1-epimerase